MTREKWAAMSKDEQNAWIHRKCVPGSMATAETVRVLQEEGLGRMAPDYVNDLNAMAEAERRLGDQPGLSDRTIYVEWLEEICNETQSCMSVFATAAQRAEAFVLTMDRAAPRVVSGAPSRG